MIYINIQYYSNFSQLDINKAFSLLLKSMTLSFVIYFPPAIYLDITSRTKDEVLKILFYDKKQVVDKIA